MFYRNLSIGAAFGFLTLMFLPFLLSAQVFTGETRHFPDPALERQFSAYQVYRLDAGALAEYVRNQVSGAPTELFLGHHHWKLNLVPSNIVSPDCVTRVQTANGIEIIHDNVQKAFMGWDLLTDGAVRLTLDDDFIYGYVEDGADTWFIEPLRYLTDAAAAADEFIVYRAADVIPGKDNHCGVTETQERLQRYNGAKPGEEQSQAEMMACYRLELAIASDFSMYQKYSSSVPNVQNHNIAVINNVQGNYTGVFIHNIQFQIVTQFVVTTAGGDPWTTSNDAGDLLDSFSAWGGNGNFGVGHDLGELWTNRDFTGTTIGIAWVDALCDNFFKYHCLQDFSGNANSLRVMTAHEIGHNLDCNHDASSGFIMSPSVSNTNTWSTLSINTVNSYLPPFTVNGCLSLCPGSTPPEADFSISPNPGCVGQSVTFTDASTGTVTSRTWNFAGTTPPTATTSTVSRIYNTAGTYNVTLTVNGPGGTSSMTQQVTIQAAAIANFTASVNGYTVTLTNTSTGATSYVWNMGDGSSFTDTDPEYTYPSGGQYTIVLVATGPCGTSTKSLTINTAPTAGFTANPTTTCTGQSVTFNNTSSANTSTYNWSFPGGTPATSSQKNPTVQYTTPGTYSVSLTVFNNAGSSTFSQPNYITVITAPTAAFTSNINGLTAAFTSNAPGATTYSWAFGDGGSSTQPNPTHTYVTGGSYTVTLTVGNICGINTVTNTITVQGTPTAAFTMTPTSGCAPLTVQFTNQTAGTGNTYAWSFPGGTPATSTAANPTVVYNTAGSYSVTLTATNAIGSNSSSQSNVISVTTTPAAAFSAATAGATATFTNTTTGATSYSWNFGDGGTSTEANPVHTYATDGAYTVTLTATNACGTATATQTVTAVTPPTAAFTASNSNGCAPLTVQFTSTSSANTTSYNWSFPGGNPASSTAQNPAVVYAAPGVYSVTLTVGNAAGTASATQSNLVTVGTTPATAFTNSVAGAVATFTNTTTGATSYSWNFGDGGTSTATSPSHTYTADGTYTVVLTATNSCGSTTATQSVTIVTPPSAAITATNNTGCNPLTVQFTSSGSANATAWSWQFPGGTPSSSTIQNPVVTYAASGMYSVTLTVSNSAGTATATQANIVTVGVGPAPAFTNSVNGTTATFTNTSSGATSYSWNFGDGGTSTATNPSHTYTTDGVYTVVLTATNACGTATASQSVTIVTPPTAAFTAANSTGCAPLTVTFTNQSSANATSYSWQFPGGTPTTSTAVNPTVVYSTPGSYSVTLTATNSAGSATATQSSLIVVNTTPAASFTNSLAGATATFTNTTTGAVSYSWNFGDGGSSTAPNPSHTYTTDGVYTVVLTATNACGTATATQTVTVVTPPTASFSAVNTIGCAPLTITFNNTSSANATSFAWQFPGGTPSSSTAVSPTVTYDTPGTYAVTLVATNGAGSGTSTQAGFVTVLEGPGSSFGATISGALVNFSNTSQNATSYSWNFGDGETSTDTNPSHTYAVDGVYTVTLTATNDCGSTTSSQVITILTPPQASFTAGTTEGCAPLSIDFINTSSANATTYSWFFEGGDPATSNLASPSATWNTPGSYTVTLIAENAAGADTSFLQIEALGVPTAGFSLTTAGLSVVLSNNSTGATSYFWDFGDGSTSTEANPTHTYATVGSYTVVLKAVNDCGETSFTTTLEITGSAPLPQFLANNTATTTGCLPFTVQFTDQSVGDPTSWQWLFPGGTPATSSDPNPVVTYNSTGSFAVSLIVTNAFGTNNVAKDSVVIVETDPMASFSYAANNGTVNFSNLSLNATSYSWDFGDGSTSTEADPTHTFTASGIYLVQLKATNSCGTSTTEQTVEIIIVGTDEPGWLQRLRVYPNPNPGQFTVELAGEPAPQMELALFNALGQRMLTETLDFSAGSLTHTLRPEALPAAVYTLRVRTGERTAYRQVVVQR